MIKIIVICTVLFMLSGISLATSGADLLLQQDVRRGIRALLPDDCRSLYKVTAMKIVGGKTTGKLPWHEKWTVDGCKDNKQRKFSIAFIPDNTGPGTTYSVEQIRSNDRTN